MLNIRHDRRCFAIWMVTSSAWAIIDAVHGIWPQAVLMAIYCGLSVHGWRAWRRRDGGRWMQGPIECERCGREWVAVHPLCERVECPACGCMTQVPPIEPSTPEGR